MGRSSDELGQRAFTVSIVTAVRRVVADEEMLPRLVASIAAFVVFSVASGLAQWYVATLHVSPATGSGQAALVFRVTMPVAIDLASMLYLSIMKVKSLKRYLAEQAETSRGDRAGQQKPLARRAGASLKRTRPSSSTINTCAPWRRREPLVIDLQRLIRGHIVATATAALTGRPGGEALVQALPAAGGTGEVAKAATPKRKSGKAITAEFETLDTSRIAESEESSNGHGTFRSPR